MLDNSSLASGLAAVSFCFFSPGDFLVFFLAFIEPSNFQGTEGEALKGTLGVI